MKWLMENVGPLAARALRALLPAALLAGLGVLVDVGLLDGAAYEAVRLGLSVL